MDAATGRVRSQRDVDAPGSVPATQLQRGALLLAGRTVYIAYGGNLGDCGPYLGRVVAAPVAGGALRSFAVPTGREAGIWAASGPAATPAGELLVTTGNGSASTGNWDHSDSVLRLSPMLELLDGFAPQGWAQENSVDADLGSTGPVLLPGGAQALAVGKGGSAYLVDVGRLGGVGGQRDLLRDCSSYGAAAAAPVAGGSGGAVAYLPCSGGLLQVRVQDGRLVRGWQAQGQVTGSPIVVGSTVWSVQQDGALYGLDAGTGRQRALLQVGAPAGSPRRRPVATPCWCRPCTASLQSGCCPEGLAARRSAQFETDSPSGFAALPGIHQFAGPSAATRAGARIPRGRWWRR